MSDDGRILDELQAVIDQRSRDRPEGSYVVRILDDGVDRIARKIGEEAAEVIVAAKNESHEELAGEVADLIFHLLLLLHSAGIPPASVYAELRSRRGQTRHS